MTTQALLRKLVAVVIGVLGLLQAVGGAWLVSLRGSAYYLLAAAVQISASIYLWRGRPPAQRLFHLLLLGTLGWALWETQGEFWGMLSRLGFVFAVWVIGIAAARRL